MNHPPARLPPLALPGSNYETDSATVDIQDTVVESNMVFDIKAINTKEAHELDRANVSAAIESTHNPVDVTPDIPVLAQPSTYMTSKQGRVHPQSSGSTMAITISTNTMMGTKKLTSNITQHSTLLSRSKRQSGISSPNEATAKLLAVPSSVLWLSFIDCDLEKEYQEYSNLRNQVVNQRAFWLGAVLVLFFMIW
ncbi:hypothetical protein HDU76_003400, partial [Blyttiomyces sp. JEL0837]